MREMDFSVFLCKLIWSNGYEIDTATRVRILDEADLISHRTDTLGKSKHPIILPPGMGTYARLGSLSMV